MSIRAALDSLLDEVSPAIRAILKRAYELGYREGLAEADSVKHDTMAQAPASRFPPATPEASVHEPKGTGEDNSSASKLDGVGDAGGPAPRSVVGPSTTVRAQNVEELEADDDDLDARDEDSKPVDWGTETGASMPASADPATTEGTLVRPILPHASVGTLRERIVAVFGLERFEIDVVICRRGDRDRRQLKSSVRLRKYLGE